MKNISGIIIAFYFVATLVSSCNEASKKDMDDASQNIKEVHKDVKDAVIANNDTAKANAISDWENFKRQADSVIADMERQATVLKRKMANVNNNGKEKLKTDLNKTNEKLNEVKENLQKRNAEFENDINKFDSTVVSKNQSFEREFKHDMYGIGTAFKDLFKDNVK